MQCTILIKSLLSNGLLLSTAFLYTKSVTMLGFRSLSPENHKFTCFLGSGHDEGSPSDGGGDVGVLLDADHTARTPRGRPTSLDLPKPRSVTPPPAGSWLRRQNRDGRR